MAEWTQNSEVSGTVDICRVDRGEEGEGHEVLAGLGGDRSRDRRRLAKQALGRSCRAERGRSACIMTGSCNPF